MLSKNIETKLPIYAALTIFFLLVILQPFKTFVTPVNKEESNLPYKKSEYEAINSSSGRAIPSFSDKKEGIEGAPILTDKVKKVLNFAPEAAVLGKLQGTIGNFKPINSNRKLFLLEKKDHYPSGIAFDRERYSYMGTNTSPARIIKYDLMNMRRVASIDLPKGRNETRVSAIIAINPHTIIHASYTNPAIFTKIDGTTMKITGTLYGTEKEANDKFIRSMTYDGKFIYAASDSVPSKISKIDPETMTRMDAVSFEKYGINNVFAITVLGHYLVGVSGNNKNAAFFRLDLNNLHHTPDTLYIPGHSNYFSLATDGKYVYAGTYTNPVNVVKVDATSKKLKYIASFAGKKDKETANFSILFDGQDVVVGTWNYEYSQMRDELIKINSTDMTRKKTLTLPTNFPAHLIFIDPYIYTSTDYPTGEIVRVKY